MSLIIERYSEKPSVDVNRIGLSKSMQSSCYRIICMRFGRCRLEDEDYSGRWRVIKKNFTSEFLAGGGEDWRVSKGKQRENLRGVWQRRFWEHVLEDEDDDETHFDYIHDNPVKHKLVKCPGDWEATNFHRWVKQGVYPADWACGKYPQPTFPITKENYGEPD